MKIDFHATEEVCKECGLGLFVARWGKGWLWFCQRCLKLRLE
ncbi:hypothetical protein ES707_20482 [subsurface metagenome]